MASFDDDLTSTIIGMECAALDRWGKGDPSGFLEICAPDVVYSDPNLERRIDGRDALSKYYDGIRGKVSLQRYKLLADSSTGSLFEADVYDLDLFDTDASMVAALQAQGYRVICYISVGSWEDWRPDAGQFPPEVIGNDYEGWPGEKWLDIRSLEKLAPILRARLDLCAAKGFDAVEPDNMDGFTNDTGFPLTAADQLRFNIWLAEEAHQRGLSIGLKNDPDQAAELEPYFDWALTEDCFADGWCEQMLPFIEAGKAVLAAEYTDTGVSLGEICPLAAQMQFSVILKNRDLDAYRATCP
ncbi:MAG: endo alpha-1,4 polygalactosaminidase [Chloroflexota bacterium]